jgi:hypothetical protein
VDEQTEPTEQEQAEQAKRAKQIKLMIHEEIEECPGDVIKVLAEYVGDPPQFLFEQLSKIVGEKDPAARRIVRCALKLAETLLMGKVYV